MVRLGVPHKLRDSLLRYLGQNSLGNRGVHDGAKHEQLRGLIGECLVSKYLTGNYPDLRGKPKGFDGGFDLEIKGRKVDVKTRGSKAYMRPDYMHNVFRVQEGHNADAYIFCNYNYTTNVLEICGWIPKEEFLQKATLKKQGEARSNEAEGFTLKADNYEIEDRELYNIRTLIYGQ